MRMSSASYSRSGVEGHGAGADLRGPPDLTHVPPRFQLALEHNAAEHDQSQDRFVVILPSHTPAQLLLASLVLLGGLVLRSTSALQL